MLWCASCAAWYRLDPGRPWPGRCPVCGVPLVRRRCTRCGHSWRARGDPAHMAQVCPRCSSPYWCRDRVGRGTSPHGAPAPAPDSAPIPGGMDDGEESGTE